MGETLFLHYLFNMLCQYKKVKSGTNYFFLYFNPDFFLGGGGGRKEGGDFSCSIFVSFLIWKNPKTTVMATTEINPDGAESRKAKFELHTNCIFWIFLGLLELPVYKLLYCWIWFPVEGLQKSLYGGSLFSIYECSLFSGKDTTTFPLLWTSITRWYFRVFCQRFVKICCKDTKSYQITEIYLFIWTDRKWLALFQNSLDFRVKSSQIYFVFLFVTFLYFW